MKTGKTITELAQSLQGIRDNSRDFLVPASRLGDSLKAIEEGGRVALEVKNGTVHTFAPSGWANSQISTYTEIPKAYYDRIGAENAGLLATSINHGFAMSAGRLGARDSGRMLRTHDGQLRAFVSSRYRRLDNYDLFEAVAPSLIDLGFEPESSELTERRMYLKVVSPKVEAEVRPGDVVRYGLVISNSDVGAGSVRVEPLIYRLICSNGMITESAVRQAHLGRNLTGDSVEDLLEDATKAATDRAFWMQVRDVVKNFARPEFFEAAVNKLRTAAEQQIRVYDFPVVVERTAKAIGLTLTDASRDSIVDNLANGADGAGLNKWGLANAFTFAAKAAALDYDSATDLERAGHSVISLTSRAWEEVNAK